MADKHPCHLNGDAVPGPGPETPFQKFCGAEYERVFAIARGMIRENTRLDGDRAEELARKVAAAHADMLYARLTGEKPAGGGRGVTGGARHGRHSSLREMQRNVAVARMGV